MQYKMFVDPLAVLASKVSKFMCEEPAIEVVIGTSFKDLPRQTPRSISLHLEALQNQKTSLCENVFKLNEEASGMCSHRFPEA